MIDSMILAEGGLRAFEQGLQTIAHNTANMNTPGFKGANAQFGQLVDGDGQGGARGGGVQMQGTRIDFAQGQFKSTGNDLDLALDGDGLFTLRGDDGRLRYTRAGDFRFDTEGVLKSTSGKQVLGIGSDGAPGAISIAAARTSAARATSQIVLSGNLSSEAATHTVGGLEVHDAAGTVHMLSARFDAVTDGANQWTVTLLDGTTTVGTGTLAFVDGRPDAAQSNLAFKYTPAGQSPVAFALDFSADVTSTGGGDTSTLAMASQDGWGPGSLVKATFDAAGVLVTTYSNGQTVRGARLALAHFTSPDAVEAAGDNEFAAVDARGWVSGSAGEGGFGSVRAGSIEGSNVDLSQQFSQLVVMQRGYQASSQIFATAGEMLDALFAMKK
ncbi:flagellar hook-basal body complex protein [Ramlibacter sp.]|uniref:flagellar hook-basal body complex protein n=1 Tax=Ramlibacter sp. TaxID=1917967 RepID=UPI003D123344